ncbi:branched-chain amino acid ABC transporter permease [Micromonospora yasonensis]|uniref:branched-chain amino acid ABC transporter permease n=1 Tax=Micromonospora yasonensis TaxID=1128667 RepID=UPI002231709F|nr:branched-chain amino acid ABC transporter permease [Micromonospora yasonensis]MCW3845097.1 branched-chain amino acid ABC transporter permease [Micromonospora yasonensis]
MTTQTSQPAAVAAGRDIRRVPGIGGLALGCAAAVLILLWVGSDGYKQTLVTSAATYALIALGMYVPYLMAGSLSMAYSAYAGIGGYAVGLVSAKTGLPLAVAWLVGPIVAALLAVLLGLVTRRLSGFFLAAVTLLFGMAFTAFLIDAEALSGGSGGLGNLRPLNLFGWTPSHYQMVLGSAVVVCVIAFLLDRLRLSPWGVIVRTMRDAPRAVEAAGVRVPVLNLVALALGAAIAAVGGGLFTYSAGSITPDTFTLNIVFLAIFMPLIGGAGTPWGAVAGAVIAVELTLNFPAIETSGTLLLALGVLVIMLVAPRGVVGYADKLRTRGWALLRKEPDRG